MKMRIFMRISITMMLGSGIVLVATAVAQPPERPEGGRGGGARAGDATSYVTRMMTFDANQDGQLSKDEITDGRLLAIFERADANQDGVVTKEELTADFNKESAKLGAEGPPGGGGPGGGGPGGGGRGGGGRGGGGRGGGGPGGGGGRGPGGLGGPGMGGPPPIGQVLPPQIQGMLKLTSAQKKKIDALQKHVDSKLSEILTEEQQHELEGIKSRGPGSDRDGFGPPLGGPGGPDGNRGRDGGPSGPRGGDNGRPKRPANDQPNPNE